MARCTRKEKLPTQADWIAVVNLSRESVLPPGERRRLEYFNIRVDGPGGFSAVLDCVFRPLLCIQETLNIFSD
jgi:hypothetical protein